MNLNDAQIKQLDEFENVLDKLDLYVRNMLYAGCDEGFKMQLLQYAELAKILLKRCAKMMYHKLNIPYADYIDLIQQVDNWARVMIEIGGAND